MPNPHPKPQYISASRRTDLPRFFYRQFFEAWKRGEITYDGGYGRSYTVSLRQDDVMGYIFWSKDFKPFIDHPDFNTLIRENNAVFGFTINDMPELEPRVPDLNQRLLTLQRLCDRVGTKRVVWRFDPIVKFRDSRGKKISTDDAFYRLLPLVRSAGVSRCIFSFLTHYPKLRTRPVEFDVFSEEEMAQIGSEMLVAAQSSEMRLFNCCNPRIRELVPGIDQARCVDNELLLSTDRFGVHRLLRPKPTRSGCGCFESRDIGSYAWRCPHGCLYCYANPC